MSFDARAAFDLTGRRAVVTGASRGIGEAMAAALASAGADVVSVARTESEGLRGVVEGHGRRYEHRPCDLADAAAVAELAAGMGEVDVLVNNAGLIRRAPAADHPDADFREVMAVNVDAAFVLAREVGRGMLARGRGKIIFTASLLTFQGGINVPGYAASKHAVAGLVQALSNEWASRGVQVNGIAPGYISTDNTAALRADEARSRAIVERIPAGRYGTPDDLAGATVFLASPASDYVTGQVLAVDGGWLAR